MSSESLAAPAPTAPAARSDALVSPAILFIMSTRENARGTAVKLRGELA